MVRLNLVLALTGLAAAESLAPKNAVKGLSPEAIFGITDTSGLDTRASSCLSFEKVCDINYCVPSSSLCCGDGNGAYCNVGYVCQTNGCCPIGKTCTGSVDTSSCDVGQDTCGNYCIPKGAVCCSTTLGKYCDAGETCTSDGRCKNGSLDSVSSTTSARFDSLFSSTSTYSYSSASSISSSTSSPTSSPTALSSGDNSDSSSSSDSNLCKRRKGGGVHVNSGGSDDCSAGNSLAVPVMLVGLLALVPAFL